MQLLAQKMTDSEEGDAKIAFNFVTAFAKEAASTFEGTYTTTKTKGSPSSIPK